MKRMGNDRACPIYCTLKQHRMAMKTQKLKGWPSITLYLSSIGNLSISSWRLSICFKLQVWWHIACISDIPHVCTYISSMIGFDTKQRPRSNRVTRTNTTFAIGMERSNENKNEFSVDSDEFLVPMPISMLSNRNISWILCSAWLCVFSTISECSSNIVKFHREWSIMYIPTKMQIGGHIEPASIRQFPNAFAIVYGATKRISIKKFSAQINVDNFINIFSVGCHGTIPCLMFSNLYGAFPFYSQVVLRYYCVYCYELFLIVPEWIAYA